MVPRVRLCLQNPNCMVESALLKQEISSPQSSRSSTMLALWLLFLVRLFIDPPILYFLVSWAMSALFAFDSNNNNNNNNNSEQTQQQPPPLENMNPPPPPPHPDAPRHLEVWTYEG
ncbi:hypothetical protein B0T20DRAFT_476332 [Sordaria brevicollis]|uniref:Uncharacterized protein n=1 Tax=Sordaria brevicollis TaxID=83679 RepID=A0AAE0PLP5_SORBR|nr:hypothetical protein B0T20DRAFT_476332 [Sordaria brevicollis]